MVFVTDSIIVSDPEKLINILKQSEQEIRKMGATELKIYTSVNNPGRVLITAIWPTHEALHQYEEKVGADFNSKIAAVKQGEWDEDVWQLVG